MGEKRRLKKEIKLCMSTIKEIERKRSRSQSALVQAILLQEQPDETDVEWFNKYTGEITACRNHMIELQKKLNDFLLALPQVDRQVFMCRYWYMDSISDIAKQFAYSESKVKSMLYRTRNKLRTMLEKEGY